MSRNRRLACFLILAAATLAVQAQELSSQPFQDVEPPSGEEPMPGDSAARGVVSPWDSLTDWLPVETVSWGNKLLVDFGAGRGLWVNDPDGASWTRLTSSTPVYFIVACRHVFATFVGLNGVYLHDGTSWISLTTWDPVAAPVARGTTGVSFNFGQGRGMWSWNCPAGLSCDFLHDQTWNIVDSEATSACSNGLNYGLSARSWLSGDVLHFDVFEDLTCFPDDETFVLEPDCSVSHVDIRDEVLSEPFSCTAHIVEGNWFRFTPTSLEGTYQEPTTHTGSICPKDCDYRGAVLGTPCDREACWPCDKPAESRSSEFKGTWERIPGTVDDRRRGFRGTTGRE